MIEKALRSAAARATAETPLRPNSVEILTGKNTGNNTADRIPWIEWEIVPALRLCRHHGHPEGRRKRGPSIAKVIPPAEGMKGVYKMVLDDIFEVDPKPCPPVIVGVGLGPTADIALKLAKKSLQREVGERSKNRSWQRTQVQLLDAINDLGWGRMESEA